MELLDIFDLVFIFVCAKESRAETSQYTTGVKESVEKVHLVCITESNAVYKVRASKLLIYLQARIRKD